MTVRKSKDAAPYRGDRQVVKRRGYFILFSNEDVVTERLCPVCDYVIRTQDDEYAMQRLNACNECVIKYAYSDLQAWNDGKRPSKEVLAAAEPRTLSFKLDIP